MNRRLAALIILWMFLLPLSALSTDELVARMEANNLELKKARQDWQTALLDVKDAKAGRGPTVDMTVSGTYMYNPPVGPVYVSTQDLLQQLSEQNVDVSLLEGQPDAYLKLYGGMEHTLYTFSLNITQPVFTWGKITDSIELYQKAADVRSLQITALERKQKSELAGRCEAVFYLLQMQKLVKEERENASRLAEIAMSARDNGLLLDVDVLKVKIQVQQIDVGLKQLEKELSDQLLAVQNLCGDVSLKLDDIVSTPDDSVAESLLAMGQDELVARSTSGAIDNLAILLRLRQVSEIAKKIASASVNWKPDFALQTSVGYGGSRFPFVEEDWYRQDDYTLNFTVAVKSTIWDGGKKLRDVTRGQAKVESSDVDYSQAVQKIRNEVVTQYLQMQLDGDRIAYQDLVVESDKQEWDQKRSLQESGYGSEMDTLKAKLQWQTDSLEKLKLLLDRNSASHALSYLMGK